jgi:hypothetical protein
MRNSYVIAGLAGALLLAGCGGPAASSSGVPSLSPSSQTDAVGQQGQGSAGTRAAALHAAAQCIRQHGIPSYADPVLTAGGQVFTDSRSIQDASQSVLDAVRQACAALAARAGLVPDAGPAERLSPDRPDRLHARPRVRLHARRDTGRREGRSRLPGGRACVPGNPGRRDPCLDAGEPEQ